MASKTWTRNFRRVSLSFFLFFPFLLHSIPVIRIIKFDRERVAQIRWNYFFADRVLIRLLVPAERIFMNVVECSEQFMRVTCSWRDWNLYCVENFNHIEDRSTLLFDVLYCESCNFISCYEDARSLFTIILRIIMTNLSIIFLDCRKLERSLIRNLKCRSSFIPVSLYSDSCFFSTHRSSSPILSSIF